MISFTISENTQKIDDRLKCLRWLATHQVDAGLTDSASPRSRFLLGIHEHGAPIMRIPPRPVIQPALSSAAVRLEMAAAFQKSMEAALDGKLDATAAGFEEAGQAAVSGIHAYIDAGISPPNAPVTLSGGWLWNRVARKGVFVHGKSGSTPLVDTGQLYNDFDYEISER